ncbi:hypothetical protein SISNIDRAFT_484887 [Sistotremastrum niveocremeum HHB9708]|uniref:Uncharacterized protein n=1 Tax=Sistotremastrum niveocremeum HHB9708 TaxID=1314777 RepID=A0A164V8K1_9AGAM|nr:hypothetical protein SISNIDRAFT_484887 [Sistotremastrum niveocremeum HHB9708]
MSRPPPDDDNYLGDHPDFRDVKPIIPNTPVSVRRTAGSQSQQATPSSSLGRSDQARTPVQTPTSQMRADPENPFDVSSAQRPPHTPFTPATPSLTGIFGTPSTPSDSLALSPERLNEIGQELVRSVSGQARLHRKLNGALKSVEIKAASIQKLTQERDQARDRVAALEVQVQSLKAENDRLRSLH